MCVCVFPHVWFVYAGVCLGCVIVYVRVCLFLREWLCVSVRVCVDVFVFAYLCMFVCCPRRQVLDLDETLVHCSVEPIVGADLTFGVDFNGVMYTVFVRKRPHLQRFLEAIAGRFEVVIFTASQVWPRVFECGWMQMSVCVRTCPCVCVLRDSEYVCASLPLCVWLWCRPPLCAWR